MQSEGKNNKAPSVYFIVPAPLDVSPGQRFRFEHYFHILKQQGFRYKISFFYTYKGWNNLYVPGKLWYKIFIVFRGIVKRSFDLFRAPFFRYVYLYREAVPLGPPIFEWILAKVLRKEIIYDFDDAIWIPAASATNSITIRFKWFSKIATICKLSYKVTVGNQFLADFAKKYCRTVEIIPTVVNTEIAHNILQEQHTSTPAIGWTGTHSTLKYLDIVLPVIRRLQDKMDIKFIVVANKDPQFSLKNYEYIQWTSKNEVSDLLKFHIGLMPLYDSDLEKGKCGFKAIQYMALGIPAVVSPVGVNTDIVLNGVNGYVAETETEWETSIEKLLTDPELRSQFGAAGRIKIEKEYSVKSTKDKFINLFK